MSSVWWRDRVLVDLTKWWERIHTRCQDHIKVPIRCHLSVHWCLISCSKTFVLTCSRRAVWVQCVCESVCFGMGGGGCDRGFYVLKGLLIMAVSVRCGLVWSIDLFGWFIQELLQKFGVTWITVLKCDYTLSFERRKGTFFLLLMKNWIHTVRNKTHDYTTSS